MSIGGFLLTLLIGLACGLAVTYGIYALLAFYASYGILSSIYRSKNEDEGENKGKDEDQKTE